MPTGFSFPPQKLVHRFELLGGVSSAKSSRGYARNVLPLNLLFFLERKDASWHSEIKFGMLCCVFQRSCTSAPHLTTSLCHTLSERVETGAVWFAAI